MQRPLRIFIDEPDVDEIDEAADGFVISVFAFSIHARAIVHDHFSDGESFPAKEREHVAMHLAADVEALRGSARIDAEGATGVVDRVGDEGAPKGAPNASQQANPASIALHFPPPCNDV